MKRYAILTLIALVATVTVVAACAADQATPRATATPAPTGTPDPRIGQILERLDQLGDQLIQLDERMATMPTPALTLKVMEQTTPIPEGAIEGPTPTPDAMDDMMDMEAEPIQEIGIIENYAATRFFPKWMVVLKDVPVRMYLTRLHREHVNRFSIQPFFSSSGRILPGEIGVIEFVPDQVGEFKISNVGHNFEATLMVVATVEEANRLKAARGKQMYALIHSVDEFRIFPDRLELLPGIPATVHNISLIA